MEIFKSVYIVSHTLICKNSSQSYDINKITYNESIVIELTKERMRVFLVDKFAFMYLPQEEFVLN